MSRNIWRSSSAWASVLPPGDNLLVVSLIQGVDQRVEVNRADALPAVRLAYLLPQAEDQIVKVIIRLAGGAVVVEGGGKDHRRGDPLPGDAAKEGKILGGERA